LRRHIAVRGIEDQPFGMLSHRQEYLAGLHVGLDAGDEPPGADQPFAERRHGYFIVAIHVVSPVEGLERRTGQARSRLR
jgi:hypothetical protein